MQADEWCSLRRIVRDFQRSDYVIYDAPFPKEDEAFRPLAERFANSGLFFSVYETNSGVMIGYVCFHQAEDRFELGYCFHSDSHGKGYALESCKAVMEWMERHHTIRQFTAETAVANVPSVRLLERLGFRMTGTQRVSFHKDAMGQEIAFEGGHFELPTENT